MKNQKQLLLRADRAAPYYQAAAALQRHVIDQLLNRLTVMRIQPQRILDVGCGPGLALSTLQKKYPDAEVLAIDLSHRMLKEIPRAQWFWQKKRYRKIQGDFTQLPLPDHSSDLIVSSLSFQGEPKEWKNILKEMKRVLKPEGLLIFSTVGQDTLKEIKQAWAQIDKHTHVHSLIDMHDLGDLMLKTGWNAPVTEMEYCVLTYDEPQQAIMELKNAGVTYFREERQRGLTGRQKWNAFLDMLATHRNEQRKIPITYEIIYAHAWASVVQPASAGPQEISIPIQTIKRKNVNSHS